MQIVLNPWQVALGIVIGAAGMAWAGPQPAIAAGAPAPVVYEHKFVALNAFDREGTLDKMSADGWEFVMANVINGTTSNFLLRRPK